MLIGSVHEFALAAAGLVLMGMIGGFAISAFRLPFGFLAAPIAGIGIFSLGIVALWGEAGVSFTVAAVVTISCGSALTIFEWWRGRLPITLAPSIVALVLLAVSVGLNDIATIRASSPSIHAGDYNDQMNYAQIADWVLAHPASDLRKPAADPVYERLSRGQLLESTRPATYFLLAFGAKLRGTSGLFAYDLVSAIAWAAGILGVAAAVARTPTSLILITIMLSTAGWLDYARTGFLGKLMAYPAALMLAALAIGVRPTPTRIFSLLLLAAGAATLHVGTVVALFVGSIGGVFLLAEFLRTRRLPLHHAYMIAGVFVAAVATTGALVRLARAPFPDENRDWPYIITRLFDLKIQRDVGLEMTDAIGHPLAALCVAISIVLGVIAWRRGRMDALAFAIAPLLVLAGLAGARANAIALQVIGFAYPATLCAIALLWNERDLARWRAAVAILAVLYVGVHIPRVWLVADRYAISARPTNSYALAEFDEVARLLKGQPVLVDTDNYIVSFVMRAELMRRGIPTQWTERGWLTAGLHYFESGRPAPPHNPGLMRLAMTPQPGWRVVYAATGFLLIAPE